MLSQLINRPCTLHRATGAVTEDRYGSDVIAEVDVETVCELQQRSRSEPGDQGETSDTGWVIFLPAGTAVSTADSVTVGEETYEFIGDPWHARNPRTQIESHVEATVRRTGTGTGGGS